MKQVIQACRNILLSDPVAEDARTYLDGRICRSGQELFEFGFFPGSVDLGSFNHLIDINELKNHNLLYEKINYDDVLHRSITCSFFENHNLVLPYKDVYGQVIAIVGRSLLSDNEREKDGEVSKYKNTSFEKNHHLFGLFQAKQEILKKDEVYICEGQFDCISAHCIGLKNVVALGSANMSFEQLCLILRYTSNIILLLDNDEAGHKGRERIKKLFSRYVSIKEAFVPCGFKDLDEFIKENTNIDTSELEINLNS